MKAVFAVLIVAMAASAAVQPVGAADAGTFKERVLYSFCNQAKCADGAGPVASLIDVNGLLYGTTSEGGSYRLACPTGSCGTAFSLEPKTGAETVLYDFCGRQFCLDGALSSTNSNLIYVNSVLYGAAGFGGARDGGTVFVLDPRSGADKVVYSFCSQSNCADGGGPNGLINVAGLLYGTAAYGGSAGWGTVFSLDPNGAENVIYSFCPNGVPCTDGANPLAGLILIDGLLYGTTDYGGTGCGTAFSVDPHTGAETVLHSFCRQSGDGATPQAGLIDVDGILYGTTPYGGTNSCGNTTCGTVFSLDPSTGAETVLHSFGSGTDGQTPLAGLLAVDGKLYGTTWLGGDFGGGTVFALDLETGAETLAYSFCSQANCADGGNPEASLIDVDGTLYGTTPTGGVGAHCHSGGCGTVFMLKNER